MATEIVRTQLVTTLKVAGAIEGAASYQIKRDAREASAPVELWAVRIGDVVGADISVVCRFVGVFDDFTQAVNGAEADARAQADLAARPRISFVRPVKRPRIMLKQH